MQLLQNSFIFTKKKKKQLLRFLRNCCESFWSYCPPAAPTSAAWPRRVALGAWCEPEVEGAAAGRGGRHSQVFCHECWALWMSLEITLWQFLAGSFVCPWALGCSRRLNPIISGWSCHGEGLSVGSAWWDGVCESSPVGKGKLLLNCTFSDPLTPRLGRQQPGEGHSVRPTSVTLWHHLVV